MPEIVFVLVKLAFVALLWAFVLTVAFAVRADLFGVRPSRAPHTVAADRPAARPKATRRMRKAPTTLVVTAGSLSGTRIPLGTTAIIIGRAPDSTVVLTDDYVSTRHAQLTQRNGEWWVEDLGSTNGTYLGNTKVTDPTPVPAGVPVVIGKTSMELRA